MMKFAVSFAALALTASVAAADPVDRGTERGHSFGKDGYVGLGTEIGDGQPGDEGGHLGAVLDGGLRLGDTPLYVHGRLAHGWSGNTGSGAYDQARIGLEARACTGILCGFAGLDFGVQRDHMVHDDFCWGGDTGGCGDSHMEINAFDLLTVPRAGIEIGKTVKFYVAAEMPVSYRVDKQESTSVGFALTAGVKYTW